jgi:hypothetical protein
MKHKKISVSEALKKLEAGEMVTDYSIDFDRIKVEALDVMKLAKGGIIVPEAAIYYDDGDIAFDEDFEGEWVSVDTLTQSKTEVNITLKGDLKRWVENNNVKLDQLIEKLLDGFYQAQKTASEKS